MSLMILSHLMRIKQCVINSMTIHWKMRGKKNAQCSCLYEGDSSHSQVLAVKLSGLEVLLSK